ncbi:carbamoyl phosphate synthase small subunit [Moraxella macacae 0408225]|uniref:Carbamoyl phosphate synthase small chain n=2 Tax=Pseudomonadota TaxID=1224 RepID=L2F7A9_9GAMM|nr:glutamine-hydrolyzing carbamoyl-phosphate synthase small subunit [Moraxella macacae]ELA08964.1 carbamoyl phosphate synthase small subunit [Moraxella macacae 0408225]
MTRAILALADGTIFVGTSLGVSGRAVGEVVFNTAMTGYQEILTDPSYAEQLVTLTYPHIGNTGCNSEDTESGQTHKVWANGLIIRDMPLFHSSFRAQMSLPDYLKQQNTVAIAEIDTRKLTRILREKGAQNGCILTVSDDENLETAKQQALKLAQEYKGLNGLDLAKECCDKSGFEWTDGTWQLLTDAQKISAIDVKPKPDAIYHVVAYDFGTKTNILRMFADRGCRLTVVPAQTPASDVLAMNPDGVFLSNGPGDPAACDYAISNIQELLKTDTPIFGICLGHQLLALASGAKTLKMPHGHHGANHPVQNLADGTVMITSQNHGFAVDESTLPDCLRPTHRSLFDGTNQGIERTDKPAFSFQGHPEASPGPHDCSPLFDRFVMEMKKSKGILK